MTIEGIPSNDQQQAAPTTATLHKEVSNSLLSSARLKSALATGMVLILLWAGFHWDDPVSWIVGLPTALIGGALTLFLPASAAFRLSPLNGLRFAKFVIFGTLRGAVDVSWRSLSPKTLQPGNMQWRTALPAGRPRQLFALTITLLPGTLTARIKDDMLEIHALDPSDATRAELAELEVCIAKLYRFDHKEMAQ